MERSCHINQPDPRLAAIHMVYDFEDKRTLLIVDRLRSTSLNCDYISDPIKEGEFIRKAFTHKDEDDTSATQRFLFSTFSELNGCDIVTRSASLNMLDLLIEHDMVDVEVSRVKRMIFEYDGTDFVQSSPVDLTVETRAISRGYFALRGYTS